MKVLVIDDSPVHQESARQTLSGHDLTLATSYEEGFKALVPIVSHGNYVAKGEKGRAYDAVLCDLLMPAPGTMMTEEAKREFENKEQPLGWALILRAVLNGTPFAALVSQTSHHDHPAAFALDAIDNVDDAWGDTKYQRGLPMKKPQFDINGAKVGFFHAPTCLVTGVYGCNWKCNQGKDDRGAECELCEGTGFRHGKDWAKVLAVLIA
jgi:CheY-like chemotaxis protein